MKKKRVAALLLSMAMLATSALPAYGATTIFQQTTTQDVVKGVTYQQKIRLTEDGWLDLYILTIDLSNENLSVEPVESKTEAGLRETVSKLLTDNGALAGVNSAYFGMTGNYSAAFGPQIANGTILSMDGDKNLSGNQFGSYYELVDGTQHFDYFKTTIKFYVGGEFFFELAGLNTITQMVYPMYLDRTAATDTSKIDARFSDLTKIVVQNDQITKISAKGETVTIPEDGYVIVLSSQYADTYVPKMSVGQRAITQINTNLDVEQIETAITGGGIILQNGQKPANYGEMASGRQPRTLLGLSQDGKTMKLIVADGKRTGGSNVSIGLTVDEAVALLKEEGMYQGLNLDGGGSSLMAVKTADADTVSTVSSPAEGSERKVMAAVGVFDDSPVGAITQLVVEPVDSRVLAGGSTQIQVFGYDENLHKIAVDMGQVTLECDGDYGQISGTTFTGLKQGKAHITANYQGIIGVGSVDVADIGSLQPHQSELYLNVGETSQIVVDAVTTDGYTLDATNKVSLSTNIGSLNGTTFTATDKGTGYITISYGNLRSYIKVVVGTEEKKVDSFENVKYLNYSSYPSGISGISGVSQAVVQDGSKSVAISYYMKESTETQAVYLGLAEPITIPGEPKGLTLSIKGNGTGQWVRGKIVDANGTESVIDFSRNVNWTDWQSVTAQLPENVAYPVKLNTIYVAALSNTNTNQQVMYFDNLRGQYATETAVDVPETVRVADALQADLSTKESGYTYINFTGNVTSGTASASQYDSVRNQVNTTLGQNTDYAFFAGKNDISAANGAQTLQWKEGYSKTELANVTILNMFAKYGGFFQTQKSQWSSFQQDALNTANQNVIVVMDKNPASFSDAREQEVFENALKAVVDAGKTVFVLYCGDEDFSVTAKDGVRYLSLPNLWLENGAVNDEYQMIRIQAGPNSMYFDLVG